MWTNPQETPDLFTFTKEIFRIMLICLLKMLTISEKSSIIGPTYFSQFELNLELVPYTWVCEMMKDDKANVL